MHKGLIGRYRSWAWVLAVVAGTLIGMVLVLAPPARFDAAGPPDPMRLRVGYAIEPPYAMMDMHGRVHGESPDILRSVLARSDLPEPVWVHLEFGQLIHELLMDRIDLIATGLFATPERARQIAFTRPTAMVSTGLLVPPFNPLGLHSLADLAARRETRLALVRGAAELELARAAGLTPDRLLLVPDVPSGITAVRFGQAAGFALSAPSLRWALQGTGAGGGEISTPFTTQTGSESTPPGRPAYAMRRDDTRLARLDAALAEFLGSPEHLELAGRYGFTPHELDGVGRRHAQRPASASGSRP
jgi:polar amino acid transport system substrate-binding protein